MRKKNIIFIKHTIKELGVLFLENLLKMTSFKSSIKSILSSGGGELWESFNKLIQLKTNI